MLGPAQMLPASTLDGITPGWPELYPSGIFTRVLGCSNAILLVWLSYNPTLKGVQGFATQHSFHGSGLCNPTLLLGLRVLQGGLRRELSTRFRA